MKARTTRHNYNRLFCIIRSLFLTLSAVILLAACRGNGGSADSGGPTYVPGGGSGGSSGGNTTGDSTNSFTAQDLLNLSNAGSVDRMIELFQTNAGSESCTVVISAAALGLPAGGSVTLTITGAGISYTADATADADGNVYFEVPLLESKTTVTVELIVRDVNGTALYAGSEEQEVDSTGNLHVGLVRQFWTLPASISLTASPDGFAYDSTKLDETTTLSISGLEDAPAGAVFTYEWELDSSPLSDSGSSLTRTWSELIGPAAPSVDLTKTFTVTVSYTDSAGETRTVSASTSVIIGPPVTIPAFTVQIVANSTNSENSSGTNYAFYSTYGGSFTFKVVEPESFFPAGTSFSWSITKSGATSPVTATGMNVTKTLEALGLTTAGVSASWTVTCTASNARAAASVTGGGDSAMSGRALKLPKFHLNVSATGSNAANNTDSSYAFIGASGEKFTVTPELDSGETAVTGMKYYWTVAGTSISNAEGASGDGHIDVDVSALSGISGKTSVSPGKWKVDCSLKYTGLSNESASTSLSAFMLKIPDFTISASAGSGLKESPSSTAISRVFLVSSAADLSKSISLTATANAGEPDFPVGTTFSWYTDPGNPTGSSISGTPPISTFCTAVPSDPSDLATYTVYCTAQFTGLTDVGPKDLQFDLKKPVKLPAPTTVNRLEEKTSGLGDRGYSTKSGNAYTFESRTNDCSKISITLAWNWTDSSPSSIPAGRKVKYKVYAGSKLLTTTEAKSYSADYETQMGGTTFGKTCTIKIIAFVDGVSDPQESEPLVFTVTVN